MFFGTHPEFPYKTKVSFNAGQLLSASEASAVFTQNLLELCLINLACYLACDLLTFLCRMVTSLLLLAFCHFENSFNIKTCVIFKISMSRQCYIIYVRQIQAGLLNALFSFTL